MEDTATSSAILGNPDNVREFLQGFPKNFANQNIEKEDKHDVGDFERYSKSLFQTPDDDQPLDMSMKRRSLESGSSKTGCDVTGGNRPPIGVVQPFLRAPVTSNQPIAATTAMLSHFNLALQQMMSTNLSQSAASLQAAHVAMTSAQSSMAKHLQCHLCEYTCKQRNSLNWHMKAKHNLEKAVNVERKTVYV